MMNKKDCSNFLVFAIFDGKFSKITMDVVLFEPYFFSFIPRYMHYFHLFGLMQENWSTTLGLFLASLAAAIVESLPISSDLDDNLTVPLTSFLVGSLVF